MKFKILIFLLILNSCTVNYTKQENRTAYNTRGFAYIYNTSDYENKIIKDKMNNEILQISHYALKSGTLVKLINPKTKDTIVLKNYRQIKFPEFYKILITKPVAERINLNKDLPYVEVLEIKKNKSFVAEKAKIYNEEKKISNKAPVASVEISNISKNKIKTTKLRGEKIFILIASFYSSDVADFLKKRIAKDIPAFDIRKLKTKKINNKKINLISGPYKAINLVKNDYILLKKFGFEELEIYIYE